MANPVSDPDHEHVPTGTAAYREVEAGRAFAEVRDWGWIYEERPERALPSDPCWRCGRSKTDHEHDARVTGSGWCVWTASGEVFDGEGDPLTRNDIFGRGPWDEQL